MSPLWRHRGFLHLWGAQAASTFGSRIGREALAFSAVILLGATPLDMAWLNAASALPYLMIGVFAGALVDRLRRRPVLIATDIVRAILLISIPLAIWTDLYTMPQLLIVTLAVSAATLFFDVAHQAYLPTLIAPAHILDANAKQEATSSASEVVGPPLGGLIVQVLGSAFAILADAVSYLLSAALLWRLPDREPKRDASGGRLSWHDMQVGFALAWRHPLFRPLLLAKFIRASFGGAFGAFYVLYVLRELGVSAAGLGLIVGCGGAAAFGSALITTWLSARVPLGPGLITGVAMSGIGAAMLPLAGLAHELGGGVTLVVIILVIGQLIGDSGLAYALSLERTLRQRRIDHALLGRFTAVVTIFGNVPGPFVALALAVFVDDLGLGTILWIAAAGYSLSWLVVLFSPIRHLRRWV